MQGACFADLRRAHADELGALPFDGLALGGFSVGEPIERMHETLAEVASALDPERPRYLMGVGTPRDLVVAIGAGVDMFDCVLPTRNARNGQALTRVGPRRHQAGPLQGRPAPHRRGVRVRVLRRRLLARLPPAPLHRRRDPLPAPPLAPQPALLRRARRRGARGHRRGALRGLDGRRVDDRHREQLSEVGDRGAGVRARQTWATEVPKIDAGPGRRNLVVEESGDPCPSDEKRPLGKILLQRKLVSQQELDAALRAQKRSATPTPLASQLVDDGTVDEVDALRALSEQYGVPGIDLTQIAILLEHLDVVPREVAETNRILPVLVRGDRIFLAMADPHEKRVIDELEFVTGKKVYPYIAVHSTLGSHRRRVRREGARRDALPRAAASRRRRCASSGSAGTPGGRTRAPPPPVAHRRRPRSAADGRPRRSAGAPRAPEAASPGWSSTRAVETSVAELGGLDQRVRRHRRGSLERRAPCPTSSACARRQAADAVVAGRGQARPRRRRRGRHPQARSSASSTSKGYRVLEADRGLLALRLVKEHVPDLIILDAMLPELHGFDIARRIKGSAKYGRIPIIMVSAVYRGWRIAEDLKQNYGVEEYLEKPFRIADLLEAVHAPARPRTTGPPQSARPRVPLRRGREGPHATASPPTRAGLIDEAIEHLKRGVGIDPLAYRLHFHLALLYGKKGQVYEGIQELERAIDLTPSTSPR